MVQKTAERGGQDAEVVDDTQLKAAQDAGRTALSNIEDDVNKMLDEIDDILEENAETFVDNFVQKGGQ